MAWTVQTAFSAFLSSWIAVRQTDIQSAASHKESMKQCLARNFGCEDLFRSGSHEKRTAVGGYSDLDFMAVLPYEVAKRWTPDDMLANVRSALAQRYPLTPIRVDRPAVKVKFAQGERSADVVPAVLLEVRSDGVPLYFIPRSAQDWLKTSPIAYSWYLSDVHYKCQKTLRPLIRIVKAWKYYRGLPVSSFYLEMFTTGFCTEGGYINPALGMRVILHNLLVSQLGPVADPLKIASQIEACTSDGNRSIALQSVRYCLGHANKALEAERNGDHGEAIRQWGIVFNGNFPRYG